MYRVRVVPDELPANPRRDEDNLGTMACWHRRYELGDVQPEEEPQEFLRSLPEGTIILPLYLLDHGGLIMRTVSFNDPWDSGQVGYIYATPDVIRADYMCSEITEDIAERVRRVLVGEVERYSAYLQGAVFGAIVEEKITHVCAECGEKWEEWREVESCYGFYGYDQRESGLQDFVEEVTGQKWEELEVVDMV